MENKNVTLHQEHAHQELLLRFFQAYDRHYPSVIAAILHYADQDETFRTELWNVIPAYLSEEEHITRDKAGEHLQNLIEQSRRLPMSLPLAYVAAQMQITIAFTQEVPKELHLHLESILHALSVLVKHEEPLPDILSLSLVQTVLHQYHVHLPLFFQQDFLHTALFLQQEDAHPTFSRVMKDKNNGE